MKTLTLIPVLFLLAANALAAGRPLAPGPLVPHRDFVQNISIAAAGDRFLAAWDANGSVYGALLDANGQPISPMAFLIAESESVDAIEVVGTGDSFAVFWIDRDSITHITNVAFDGRVLGTRRTELPQGTRIDAAWNGEQFGVVIFGDPFRPNASRAALLDREGNVLHDIRLHVGITIAQIVADGTGFLAFTGTRNGFYAHPIARDGGVSQISAGDIPAAMVSMRVDAETLLLVTATTDGTVRSMLWKNGAKLREQIVATQHLGGLAPIHLMRGEDRHLLVLANSRTQSIMTMELNDEGLPLNDPVDRSDKYSPNEGASNASTFVVLHRDGNFVNSLTFDRKGTVTSTEILSIRPAEQLHAVVGAGGGAMLAIWNERAENETGFRVRTAMIDRDFEPQNVRELSSNGALVTRTLPWDGGEYLVVYRQIGNLFAARVSYDGTPIGEPTLIAGEAFEARGAATWAGDRWLIAWSDGMHTGPQYATMWRGGSASPARPLPLTNNFVSDLALAFDGSRVHVAWVERPFSPVPEMPQGFDVFTTRLRRDGRIVDPAPLAIPVTLPNRVSLAASNERVILVVDEEESSSLHAIDAKSRRLLSSQRLLKDDFVQYSDVTWTGWEFFAASRTHRSLFVWRLGRDGTALDDVRGTEPLPTDDDRGVSIAATPSYDAVLGLQETDAASGSRAVIYANRELPRKNP